MPRRYEIESAFRDAVRKEASNWIECYITTFKDISDQEGEARTFMLYNPNNEGN